MLRRVIITGLIILLSFILQTTLFKTQFLSFGLVTPNLLLMVTFIFGFMKGKKTGVIVGFFCGLIIDIYFSNIIGLNPLLYMFYWLYKWIL